MIFYETLNSQTSTGGRSEQTREENENRNNQISEAKNKTIIYKI